MAPSLLRGGHVCHANPAAILPSSSSHLFLAPFPRLPPHHHASKHSGSLVPWVCTLTNSVLPDEPGSALGKLYRRSFTHISGGIPPPLGQQTVPTTASSIKTELLMLLSTHADCQATQQLLNQVKHGVRETPGVS